MAPWPRRTLTILALLAAACQRLPAPAAKGPEDPSAIRFAEGPVPEPQPSVSEPSTAAAPAPAQSATPSTPVIPWPIAPAPPAAVGSVLTQIPYVVTPGTLGPVIVLPLVPTLGLDIALFDIAKMQRKEFPVISGLTIESRPFLVDNGRWLYFTTNAPGNLDIWRLDVQTNWVDTLDKFNSDADASEPYLTLDGDKMAYVKGPLGQRILKLRYGMNRGGGTGQTPALNDRDVGFPTLNFDASLVAYSCQVGSQRDIHIYDIVHAAELTPPFINDPSANEELPWLLPDGSALLFTSDRRGSPDIYLADFRTGRLDDLPLANTPAIETLPIFIGGTTILFLSNRSGVFHLYTYDWVSHKLDTLPF